MVTVVVIWPQWCHYGATGRHYGVIVVTVMGTVVTYWGGNSVTVLPLWCHCGVTVVVMVLTLWSLRYIVVL